MCTHCGTFKLRPGYSALFLEHLKSRHREAAHADTLSLSPALQFFASSDFFEPFVQLEALDASLPDFEDF